MVGFFLFFVCFFSLASVCFATTMSSLFCSLLCMYNAKKHLNIFLGREKKKEWMKMRLDITNCTLFLRTHPLGHLHLQVLYSLIQGSALPLWFNYCCQYMALRPSPNQDVKLWNSIFYITDHLDRSKPNMVLWTACLFAWSEALPFFFPPVIILCSKLFQVLGI